MSPALKHILYIAEFSTGGSVESLLCLVGGLDKSMFRATVLFYSLPDERTCDRFEKVGAIVCALYPRKIEQSRPQNFTKLNLQAKIRRIFGARIERLFESFKYGLYYLRFRRPVYKAICRQIDLLRPDLVHLNNGVDTDLPGMLAARKCKVPAVCHLRTLGTLTHISVTASRSVSAFICISNAVKGTAVAQGVSEARCFVVANSVNITEFSSTGRQASNIRGEFGWNESHKIFSLVGRVVPWKGQDFFIRALAEAYRSDDSIRGLIVGDGGHSEANDKYIADLQSLVSKLDLEGIVRFTGHRTDIPDIMRSSDAVICASSLPEPFGRVIIESMAVNTAVIATNAGGAADIIDNDVNGLLVPMKDSQALAAAMRRLCLEEGLSERLRSAATIAVHDRYTVAKHVDQVCNIYKALY